ncbi:serine hydrolase domain-containing protein [Portibacter lacus]|uniref:Serine hydrolase n=1 Tax=Portibacter lacus TaxID=1099794 RepID=A0AA37WER0_9BACT|nr:serine hydrolase domain-containing protein [Portibacter lacus]GLR16949.1 serine hydrolase [Portibacter lacus]
MLKKQTLFLIVAILILSCKKTSKQYSAVSSTNQLITLEVQSKIDSTIQSFVTAGDIAGGSALIIEKGKEVYYNHFGFADRENKTPFDRKTIVQIYSMTKPITGTALMTLHEDGKFQLDEPLSNYAPEFENMTVYKGVAGNGQILTEQVNREITIRDITRHTTGFAGPGNSGLGELVKNADALNRENTLTEMAIKIGATPLLFHPGSQWEYGSSVDVQAFLVERISGIPYGEYVRMNVLAPLGMDETRYFIPDEDRSRFSAMYNRSQDGVLSRVPDEQAHSNYVHKWPLTRGGSGLTSTIDDYMKFAQMLLNNGTYGHTTILKPETVELMSTNHLSDTITERSWLPKRGQVGFGIDFAVRLAPPISEDENMGEVGEFFWDGAASTLFWVDPVNEMTVVLFVQLMPYDQIGLHRAFRKAVYSFK